jgi:homoserine kinase
MGVALQLYNKFVFEVNYDVQDKLTFKANFPLKQNPRSNLVYKAYCYTLECVGFKGGIPGLDIYVLSDIPSARGLGSSASAVVAGVLAAGAISGTNLRLSEAIEIATSIEGHPDNVAPAILGGMTVSIQEKNMVYSQKLEWPDELAIIVGIPDIKVRTQSARRVLPKQVSFEDAVFNLRRTSLFVASLIKKDWRGLSIAMHDKLHQNVRASLIPGLTKVLGAARDAGAIGAVLSGSGPCILSVVQANNHNAIKAVGNSIKRTWQGLKIDAEVKQLAVQKPTTKIKKITEEEFRKLIDCEWQTNLSD